MSELTKRIFTSVPLVVLTWIIIVYAPFWLFSLAIICVCLYILAAEWPKLFSSRSLAFWVIMPFYPLLPMIILVLLRKDVEPCVTLFLFSSVACHDIASYSVGKVFGKHKLWPSVSPGKTWEGFIGGSISTVAFNSLVLHRASWFFTCCFTFVLCSLALLGDLFESILKRRACLKDTGTLLPGHGGLLDRLDSILFAVFIVYPLRHYLARVMSW